MSISTLIVLGMAGCGMQEGEVVDGRRPGSPTAAAPSERQGDTLGGADSFPAKTSKTPANDVPTVMVRIDPTATDSPSAEQFVAVVQGTDAAPDLHGVIRFQRSGEGVVVTSNVDGLPPGAHGMHVHVYGDCSAPETKSVGDHLDFSALPGAAKKVGEPPTDAAPNVETAVIVGDLGELTAANDGHAAGRQVIVALDGPAIAQLNGRAVVIHAGPNDPTHADGGAGTPIACGVVGVAGGTATPETAPRL